MNKIFVFLLFSILPIFSYGQHPAQVAWFEDRADEWKGFAFPEFELQDQDGQWVTEQDFQDEVTVVRFFFTGCPPCRNETERLNSLYESYHEEGVKFIAFSTDTDDRTRTFRQWKKHYYQVIPDARTFIQKKMHVGVFPTHMVINKKGQITDVFLGTDWFVGWKLRRAIRRAQRQD